MAQRGRWPVGRLTAAVLLAALLPACASDDAAVLPDGPSTTAPAVTTAPVTAAPTTEAPTTGPPATEPEFPGATWATVDPAAAGFDPARLDELATRAEAGGSNCLVVTRHGRIVFERNWNGTGPDTAQEVFSVTKSVTAMLVGIAADDGALQLSDPASNWIEAWRGTPSAGVTVRNLLSNDSGRHWDFATDYSAMAVAAPDKTAFAIGLGQDAPPGTVWAYNNSAIQTLDEVLVRATGVEPADYARQRLFEPIGMTRSTMTTDPAGNTRTFMGLQSTCRDLARFGLLALRGGRWEGRPIVSAAFVEEATGRPSTPLNAAYGYLWWLNRTGPQAGAAQATTAEQAAGAPDGQLVPGAPEELFFALGLGDQIVAVFPEQDVVTVRLGPARPPGGTPGFTVADAVRGTLAALVDP